MDNPTTEHNILPKVKSKIIYFNPDSESWNEALVLERAGKCNGIQQLINILVLILIILKVGKIQSRASLLQILVAMLRF